jgi:hypothetical protein
VNYGEEMLQPSASIESDGFVMTQAINSDDGTKTHSKEQRVPLSFGDMEQRRPIEITTMFHPTRNPLVLGRIPQGRRV